MCSFELNRNGIVGTMRLGADVVHRRDVDAHQVERADLRLLDRVLLAAERLPVKTLIVCLPPVFLLMMSLMYLTAITVG